MVDDFVPNDMKERVLSDSAHVRGSVDVVNTTNDDNNDENAEEEQEINPIRQEAVTVSGDHGAVYIDTIGDLEVGGAGAAGMNVSVRNQLLGLQSCLLSMRQENFELKNALNTLNMKMERGFGIINGNVQRIAMRPGRIVAAAVTRTANLGQNPGGVAPQQENAGGDRAVMTMATLMATPRSLHDLWQEFQHGVGGRKVARLFSYSERVRSEFKYCRRKVVWDLIAGLVRQGYTADAGIVDRIYAVWHR